MEQTNNNNETKSTKIWAENLRLKKQIKELQQELESIKKFIGGLL